MLFGLLKTKNEKAIEELQEQVMIPNYIEVKQDLSPLQSEEVITTDLELDKGNNLILVDRASEERYRVFIDSGYLMIEKCEEENNGIFNERK